MLERVARIAQRQATVDLGLIWRYPVAAPVDALTVFDTHVNFDFPLKVQFRTWARFQAAMRGLDTWAASRRVQALVAFGFAAAVRGALVARHLGVPIAWMCQESADRFLTARPLSRLRWAFRILRWARVDIVATSNDARQTFERLSVLAPRLHVIRNGVNVARFARAAMTPAAKLQWRTAHAIPTGDLTAVCVARLDPVKRHDVLLDAVRVADDRGIRVVLVCVGGAGPGMDSYAAGLRQRAAALRINDRVVWAGSQADVREWFGMADVAVLASCGEAGPLALAEAGAVGLPLVGSDVAGIRDFVVSHETGLRFTLDDVQECGAALVALAREPALRERLGAGAAAHVSAHYDARVLDGRWAELLSDLLQRGAY